MFIYKKSPYLKGLDYSFKCLNCPFNILWTVDVLASPWVLF